MTTASSFFPLFFFLSFSVIGKAEEGPAALDDYWKERAGEAEKHAMETYEPNPGKVTEEFNAHVEQFEIGKNSTRRSLTGKKRYSGPCKVSNPIDACWRCDPNWANDRKKLASCAQGFGRKTTGGKDGPFYVVTDASDDDVVNPKPGTLRHAVIQKGPLWITFAHRMVITLQQELIMTSDKTIDARGANVMISKGSGLTLQFVRNVIISNLLIKDIVPKSGGIVRDSVDHLGFRTRSVGDGITIYGSSNIWIDHVSMARCTDGLIDATRGSTGITISNSHFTHHNKVMLFGHSNTHSQDKIMQVTLAFNHFGKGLVQRMPRCRFGFFHVVNNDYTHWLMYAIGGSMNPTIISQGNRFIAPPNDFAKEVTKREYTPESEWKDWEWTSQGDLMMNGAFFIQSGKGKGLKPNQTDIIPFQPGTMVTHLTKFSGSLECFLGKPC